MLQQTQVKTVVPYFERFISRFPDVATLASASEQDVLASWSGLGYYRRAKALHRAAKWVMEENGGRFPETLDGWLALPGVGRYTAGAILSIAYDQRVPILDGNVARVLSRMFLVRGDPRSSPVLKILWQKAEELLPLRAVSDFNQALMELGALVCTPRGPRCLVCPIQEDCKALEHGVQEELPELAARKASVPVVLTAAVIRRRGKVLMYQREDEELMRGLWEFPGGPCRTDEEPRGALVREARERYGLWLESGTELTRVKHNIMNRRITLHAFEARLTDGSSRGLRNKKSGAWIPPEKVAEYPVSSMTLKVLRGIKKKETRQD
jgi:A/G-specific adenine glycosylase